MKFPTPIVAVVVLLVACAHAPVVSTPPVTRDAKPVPTPLPAPRSTSTRQDQGGSIAVSTPVRGAPTALVTVVEFGDFQCPFCARAQETLEQVRELYGDRVRFAFRHRPLSFHVHAQAAAEAAVAAQQQGKFWEMHDRLFAASAHLDDETIAQAARDIGLDMPVFEAALRDRTYQSQIADETRHAEDVKVNGTPSFFVNGRVLHGAQPLEKFKALIDDELRITEELSKLGIGADKIYDVRLASAIAEKPEEPRAPPTPNSQQKALIAKWTPIRGPKLAKVTIVEYSDMQCPFCARASATLKQLRQKYGNDLRIAYRHNPLPFHDRARVLSNMAMAAHAQGKFWEMHDWIFEHQRELPSDTNGVSVARTLGLDVARYNRDLAAQEIASHIDADIAEAARLGASGTPTFYINGRALLGAQPIEAFEKVIEEERTKAQALLDAGTPLAALYDKILASLPSAQP